MARPDGPTLLSALAETGGIGSTTRQLAERVARPLPSVARSLEALSDRGRVVQIGRGLWILSDFQQIDALPGFVDPAVYVEKFRAEGGCLVDRYEGPIASAENEEVPVHRWWPYVQGYSAAFVGALIERNELPPGATVLDPFSGSGTTAVEARRRGFRAVGAELLPPAVLAARVKTRFELDGDRLVAAAGDLVERARATPPGPLPFLTETPRHFAPVVLDQLLRLRDALPPRGTPVGDALRIAFGRILIPVSRLRRSPCLGYGGVKEPAIPPDVFDAFLGAAADMRTDLARLGEIRRRWGPVADIREVDARRLQLPEGSVALAVTSPPYVNGMDYVMNYKLDLAWLGYSRSYAELTELRESMVACDNLPRGSADGYLADDASLDPWLPEITQRIAANVTTKRTYRRNDVHGIVNRYFSDLKPVLARVARSLAPGGRFVLVVGDSLLAGAYVPGDLLLARMGASVGLEIEKVEIARARRSGQRRSFVLRESIVTLRAPGGSAG